VTESLKSSDIQNSKLFFHLERVTARHVDSVFYELNMKELSVLIKITQNREWNTNLFKIMCIPLSSHKTVYNIRKLYKSE
jgi:hypothetical protein